MAVRNIEIPAEMSRRLESLAARRGETPDTVALELLGERLEQEEQRAGADPLQSLLQLAREVRSAIPPEELARVPEDAGQELDHYLYGTPRRGPTP
jgi:aryl-alcohol dehydrogenase-like predicted oxidoreductase